LSDEGLLADLDDRAEEAERLGLVTGPDKPAN